MLWTYSVGYSPCGPVSSGYQQSTYSTQPQLNYDNQVSENRSFPRWTCNWVSGLRSVFVNFLCALVVEILVRLYLNFLD